MIVLFYVIWALLAAIGAGYLVYLAAYLLMFEMGVIEIHNIFFNIAITAFILVVFFTVFLKLLFVGNTMLDAFYTVKERKKGDQNG